jgi:hypothetical protein
MAVRVEPQHAVVTFNLNILKSQIAIPQRLLYSIPDKGSIRPLHYQIPREINLSLLDHEFLLWLYP